jgi:hypothetical protein
MWKFHIRVWGFGCVKLDVSVAFFLFLCYNMRLSIMIFFLITFTFLEYNF